MSSITGVGDFETVKSQSETIEISGFKVKVMNLDTLIQAKSAMKREKDVLAVKELKAIRAKKNT
jgi:predicted nucleotidyltransferase